MLIPALTTGAALLAAIAAGLCLRACWRSLPEELTRRCVDAEVKCVEVLDRLDRIELQMATWHEDVSGMMQAIEVKRKRVQTLVQRLPKEGQDAGEFDPTNLDHLKRRARELGHKVM